MLRDPMRAAVGVAVVLGSLAGLGAAGALPTSTCYRDRKGVLHITNAPVDPGAQLDRASAAQGADPRCQPRADRASGMARPSAALRALPAASRRAPSAPGVPTPYDELIREIADRYDVEYALVKAVIKAESGFNHLAVSPKGAQGLMQLMPATAAQHQVQDAFTPQRQHRGRRAAPASAARPLRRQPRARRRRLQRRHPRASKRRAASPTSPRPASTSPRVLRYRLGVPAGGRGCPRRPVADAAARAVARRRAAEPAEPASASASSR